MIFSPLPYSAPPALELVPFPSPLPLKKPIELEKWKGAADAPPPERAPDFLLTLPMTIEDPHHRAAIRAVLLKKKNLRHGGRGLRRPCCIMQL